MAEDKRQAALQRSIPIPFQASNTTREFTSTDLGNVDEIYFDQVYENCFLTTILKEQKNEEKQQYVLKKRPGWIQNSAPAANTEVCTALYWWKAGNDGDDNLFSVWGTTTNTVYKGTTSLITLTPNRRVKFFDEGISGTTKYIAWTTNTDDLYIYDNSTVTEITDAQMPGNAGFALRGPPVLMDGYIFVLTQDGRIYNSDLDAYTSWDALSFISTNSYPDFNAGMARYKNQLVVFGRESLEFYTNVGNPVASPLQRNLTISIRVGCAGEFLHTSTGDTLAWIGSPPNGRMGLYYLDGYTAVRVEDPKIDFILKYCDPATSRLQAFNLEGYEWVMFTSHSTFPAFCYNLTLKTWFFMSSSAGVDCWELITSDQRNTIYGANTESNAATNGKTFKMSVNTYQDASTNYPVIYISQILDLGTGNQKRMYKLRVMGDKQTSTTTTTIKTSDDDYRNWTTRGTVDMSTFNTSLYQLGSFRRRAFRLEYTGSNPWRVHRIETDFSFGVH